MTLTKESDAQMMETVLVGGDLEKLSAHDRLVYYQITCKSLGVNPLTKPFSYIKLNNKLVLYANRDCTDQLRHIRKISIVLTSKQIEGELYIVTAKGTDPEGRTDESTGAVYVANLKGDALANAIMKCETKAKRRVTLSICGLGWLDETEIETIPEGRVIQVDATTGEIHPPPASLQLPAKTKNYCEGHKIKLGKHPTEGMVHKLPDGSWCHGVTAEPTTQATEEDPPISETPPFPDTPLGELQREVFEAEMEWPEFESLVLHNTWEDWVKLTGHQPSGPVAKARQVWQAHQRQEPPQAARD